VQTPADALAVDWYELRSGELLKITTVDQAGQITPGQVAVKSYGDVARDYAVHPESKFVAAAGSPCLRTTIGILERRSVSADRAEYIGKEGNRISARVEGAGVASEVQEVYEDPEEFSRIVLPALRGCPTSIVATHAGISERAARALLSGAANPRPSTRRRLVELVRWMVPDQGA